MEFHLRFTLDGWNYVCRLSQRWLPLHSDEWIEVVW